MSRLSKVPLLTSPLLCLLLADGTSVTRFEAPEGPKAKHISAIHEAVDGVTWVGTRGGVSLLAEGEWGHVTEDELGLPGVTSILPDGKRGLWFTGPGGVTHFDGEEWKQYATELGRSIRLCFNASPGGEGETWFATNAGAVLFDGESWEWVTTETGLKHDVVHDVQRDNEGNTWFATRRGGLSMRDQTGAWQHFFPTDNVRGILLDSTGQLWFGTGGNGVLQYDGSEWTRHHPKATVLPIFEDSRGNVWFSKGDSGALRIRNGEWTEVQENLPKGELNCGMESSDRGLWFGAVNGLHKLEKVK